MAQFYKCDVCDQILGVVKEGMGTVTCCGQNMVELKPGVVDASHEKHVPYVTVSGTEVIVQVGSSVHPMLEEHRIEWVCLKTTQGFQLKYLEVGQNPLVHFFLDKGEKPVMAYAYCNIHGLWSAVV